MAALALFFFFRDGLPVTAVTAEVYRLISSPTLPAIPLLTACGYVLAESDASLRLLRFFKSLLGWMPGGLAVIVIAVCALFTTFTGGSGITVIAIGGLVLPMLLKDGYPEDFSLGLVTAAGSLGLLFPPSLPVILYSVVAGTRDHNVPADSLYLAGLLPGLLMIAMVAAYAVRRGQALRIPRQAFSPGEVGKATWEAKWELSLPVLVVGLFMTGRTSMVETAALAMVYAIVVECFVTKDLDVFRTLPTALVKSSVLAGSVLILLSAAMGITSYIVDAQIPDTLVTWVQTHIESRWVFLLALNGLLIIVGCLVDIFSAIVVLAPLLVPMATAFGVDPVHLGVIFLANLELGYLTPPVGLNLYLAASRFDKPLTTVVRTVLPFLLIMALAVLLITYVPQPCRSAWCGSSAGSPHVLRPRRGPPRRGRREQLDEATGHGRDRVRSLEQEPLRVHPLAVDVLVAVLVLLDHRALQREPREEAPGARVAQDLGAHAQVGRRRARAPHRPRRHRRVRPERELRAHQVVDALRVHHQEHVVGLLPADLKAEAAAAERDHERRPPGPLATLAAAHHRALAPAPPEAEGELLGAGDDGHALGLVEEIAGDALLPAQELLQHLAAGLEAPSLLDLRGGEGGDQKRDEGEERGPPARARRGRI